MKEARREAYWNIDEGGKSWLSELTPNAQTVIDFRLRLKSDEQGKVIGQYGWRFDDNKDSHVDLLISDPLRVQQAEIDRQERLEAIALELNRMIRI